MIDKISERPLPLISGSGCRFWGVLRNQAVQETQTSTGLGRRDPDIDVQVLDH
jgi:hypothetical protein